MTGALEILARECQLAKKQVAAMEKAIAALKGHGTGGGHISAKGKRNIRLAQKARWQKFHKQQTELAKKGK